MNANPANHSNQDSLTGGPSPRPRLPVGFLRGSLLASLGTAALLGVLSYWVWRQLPEGVRIPMHWDASGKVNGYGGRGSLFFVPALLAGISLVFYFVPRLEPRREHIVSSSKAFQAVWLGMVALFSAMQIAILAIALGHPVAMDRLIYAGVGLLFTVMGNYLGKVRSNYFFGVRTPWTLSSELSWNKTHRLVGRMFVGFGLALLAAAVVHVTGWWLVTALVASMMLLVVVAFGYSYVIWREDPDRVQKGAGK